MPVDCGVRSGPASQSNANEHRGSVRTAARTSRSKASITPSPSRITRPDSGPSGALSSARQFWSASVTWIPATGAPTCQGGAQFKYGLLWVVGVASLMAIFMQVISARLGVVTGKDLAQCCRDWYPAWTRWPNWLMCELAIGACDLAEVLGSAVALNLLFHIPLFWAVIITGLDVLLLLALQNFGMRTIEAVILLLIATISVCYFIEIFVLPETQPELPRNGQSHAPPAPNHFGMVYIAIGIIGATVMPHNLYLHSALVQSRQLQKDDKSIRRAIQFNTLDSTVALTVAFFVNAAISSWPRPSFSANTNRGVDEEGDQFQRRWIKVLNWMARRIDL